MWNNLAHQSRTLVNKEQVAKHQQGKNKKRFFSQRMMWSILKSEANYLFRCAFSSIGQLPSTDWKREGERVSVSAYESVSVCVFVWANLRRWSSKHNLTSSQVYLSISRWLSPIWPSHSLPRYLSKHNDRYTNTYVLIELRRARRGKEEAEARTMRIYLRLCVTTTNGWALLPLCLPLMRLFALSLSFLLLAIGEIQFGISFRSKVQYAERVEWNASHVRTHRYIPMYWRHPEVNRYRLIALAPLRNHNFSIWWSKHKIVFTCYVPLLTS